MLLWFLTSWSAFKINFRPPEVTQVLCSLQFIYEGRNRAGRILKLGEVLRGERYVRENVCAFVYVWGSYQCRYL